MARRSDHTREEIRDMAIRAGQDIIQKKGLSDFSAREVAKQIGYTVGTLYNVFEDYDDILLHIHAATLDDLTAFITKRNDAALSGKEAVKQLAYAYVTFATKHYNRWSALFEYNLPAGKLLPDWYAEKIGHMFVLVESVIAPMLDNDTAKAKHASKVLWASIHGICILGLTGKLERVGATSIGGLIDSLLDNYLRGLLK